jgi:glycine/D-amino acid oxidase-like deaminating enzyme
MTSAIVVGAGVLGASLADRLARSSWDVTLVEQVAPGHVRSGSGDESRLIRCAHGDDVLHTEMARRAMDLWRELDPDLIAPAGMAWFARREDGWEARSEQTMRELGIPCERVDATQLYPSVRTDDLAFTLYEPEAGILHARNAVKALAKRAQEAGAKLIGARATPDSDRVRIDDQTLEADHVVWACGAWLPGLFGDLLDLRVTQQDVFYFGADARWATPGVPGFVDYDGAAYGLGDLDGRGVKVAPDVDGPPLGDPDRSDRIPRPEHERLARTYLAHRFPALADAPLVGTRVCQYELTPDTRFIVAPHPEHGGRVWIVGGGSGHAFKHGPVLAERLQAWISGAMPAEPRFALGDRRRDVQLRTSGTGL